MKLQRKFKFTYKTNTYSHTNKYKSELIANEILYTFFFYKKITILPEPQFS